MPGGHSRRQVLATVGALSGSSIAGCTTLSSSDEQTPTTTAEGESPTHTNTATAADAPVSHVSIPSTETDYPVMGARDAPERATLYGGWKCPYTRLFALQILPQIVTEYVESGALQLQFRAVRYQAGQPYGEDEPRANDAGLAVWHERPERFWSYFTQVVETQQPETQAWATTERLVELAAAAGVDDTEPIAQAVRNQKYESQWQQTMQVVRQRELTGTPRLALGGEITAPTVHPTATATQLRDAVGEQPS